MEHPLVNVVGEHEEGVDVAGGAARHAYVGERHGSKADRSESVPKHGQVGRGGIRRDGVCFDRANPETKDIRATESQGCDPIPLRYDVRSEDTIHEQAIRYAPLDRGHPTEGIWWIVCYHRASAGSGSMFESSTIKHDPSMGLCI